MTKTYRRLLSTALVAAASMAGIAASEGDALAGVHIHIGGGIHVGVHIGGAHGTVHWQVSRPPPPPMHIHVGGAIWVGGGVYYHHWSEPPPAYSGYACDCAGSYYPVQPGPYEGAYATVAAPAPPPLPRWGIGVAAGGVNVQGTHTGDDLALLGRLRLTPGLLIEGEVGKDSLVDNTRVDRRLGASLVYEIGAYNRWAPYGVLGGGVTQVDVGGGSYQSDESFGELGVGLRFAVTDTLHIAADIRAGSRAQMSSSPQPLDAAARSVAPPPDGSSEDYTRARLSAILYF